MSSTKLPPITDSQWIHIMQLLAREDYYGARGTVRAWQWLTSQGRTMSLRTFQSRLRIEKEQRRIDAEKEMQRRLDAEAAALRAPPAVPIVDGMPLVGASFVQEGAPEPPAEHGGLAAPPARTEPCAQHDLGHNAHEPGSADDSQATSGLKRTHGAAFSSSDGVEPEVQGDLGLAAEASDPPADLSDGSDQPPLLLQTVNTAPCTRAPPPPADAGAWDPGATCPVCRADLAATVRVVQSCGSEGTVRSSVHSCNVCIEAVAIPDGSSVLLTAHYPPGARADTPLIALVNAPDGPDPLAAALAEAGAAYVQFADRWDAQGELNGDRLLLNVAVEAEEDGTYVRDRGWTPGWVGEATNPRPPPDSAVPATYTRPPCGKRQKAKGKAKLRSRIAKKDADEFMLSVSTLYDAFAAAAQGALQRDVNSGKLDGLIRRMEGGSAPFGLEVRVLHLDAGEGIMARQGADKQSYHKDELAPLMWQVCCCHARVCSEMKPVAVRRRGRCSFTAARANRRRCWCATNEAIGRGAWRSSSEHYTAATARRASGGTKWRG